MSALTRAGRAAQWACFAAGFYAAYFASTALPTPLLWYYPLQRRFALEVKPSALAMDFMGRVLLAAVAGAVASLLGRALIARRDEPGQQAALELTTAWAAALLLFTAALYVYILAGRNPLPVPLPPDYVPR